MVNGVCHLDDRMLLLGWNFLVHSGKRLSVLLSGFFFIFVSSCVTNQEIEPGEVKAKPIYEYRDIRSSEIAFVPGSSIVVINRAENAVLVDFVRNKIVKILPSPNPDDLIDHIDVSEKSGRLLMSTPAGSQVWDLEKFKLLAFYQSQGKSRISGLSPDGRVLLFNKNIYNIDAEKLNMEFTHDAVPFGYAFSDDMRYLVIDGHVSGSSVLDLASNTQRQSIVEKGMKQIRFKKDSDFYAGYGAELSPALGGYYSSSIGLYSISTLGRIADYSPPNKISCWVKLANDKVLAAQTDGVIELLNEQLVMERSWMLGDKISQCAVGQSHHVWLAGEKGVIYTLDTDSGGFSRMIESIHSPVQLIVSHDGRYLGVLKSVQDGSHVNIYSLN